MRRLPRAIVLPSVVGASAALTIACATIIHGSSQQVGISSQPTGAEVTVDNKPLGKTPVIADLRRKDNHVVHIALDGYQPFDLQLTRSVSGWIAGNIIFGGVIGLAVDAITGGMYNVKPDEVSAQLGQGSARVESRDGVLYVFLVQRAQPQWEKIGQLHPSRHAK